MKRNPNNRYRVLLMCKNCDKVYNGTPFVDYEKAVQVHFNTLIREPQKCKKCEEPLVTEIQDMNGNKEKPHG